MVKKVKECSACGQGFDEDNNPVGGSVPSVNCQNGIHQGPINRIVASTSQGSLITLPISSSGQLIFPISSYKSPLPTCSSKRSTAKQESFKKKLYRRKRDDKGICEICGRDIDDLEGTHIVDVQFAELLYQAYETNRALPASVNDLPNGLLLCANCHVKFDKPFKEGNGNAGRIMRIDKTGTIHLFGNAKAKNYEKLDGKKVPWADQIDKDKDYPTSAVLDFAFKLKKASKDKRIREILEEEEEEEEEEKEEPAEKEAEEATVKLFRKRKRRF